LAGTGEVGTGGFLEWDCGETVGGVMGVRMGVLERLGAAEFARFWDNCSFFLWIVVSVGLPVTKKECNVDC
jgi:hypothetical protein